MTEIKVGDKVKVVRIAEGFEDYGYAIGDVHTVTRVNDDTSMSIEPDEGVILDTEEGLELYENEVELYEEPEKSEYDEIVESLSQAIADKAAQMAADNARLIGDHFSMGAETPVVDMVEEDMTAMVQLDDSEIFTELKGRGEHEANGILQEGITPQQALAARDRALAKKRKADLDEAVKALRVAQEKYDEVAPKEYTEEMVEEDTAAIERYMAESPNPMGNVMDNHWMNDEPVGKEVIYDVYNPDVVQAPAHYVNSKIEPIDYMADKLPAYDDGHTAFCVGNVIKYVSRAPHKGKLVEDLEKAAKYLEFAIEHEKGKQ